QLFQRRGQMFGAAENGSALGARLGRGCREEARGEGFELFHFGMCRSAPPRIGVAGSDQQGVRPVDPTGFDQQLKGFVGLKSKHFWRNRRLNLTSKSMPPHSCRQFVSRLLTLTIS